MSFLTNYLFQGGAAPSDPFPLAGDDPTVDTLHVDCYPPATLNMDGVSITYLPGASGFEILGNPTSTTYCDQVQARNLLSGGAWVSTSVTSGVGWQLSVLGQATDLLVLQARGPGGISLQYFPDEATVYEVVSGLPSSVPPDPSISDYLNGVGLGFDPDVSLEDFSCGDGVSYELARNWNSVYVRSSDTGVVDTITPIGDFIFDGAYVEEEASLGAPAQLILISCTLLGGGSLSCQALIYTDQNGDGYLTSNEQLLSVPLGDVIPTGTSANNDWIVFFDLRTAAFRRIADTNSDNVPDSLVSTPFFTLPMSAVNDPFVGISNNGLVPITIRDDFELYYASSNTHPGATIQDVDQDGVGDIRVSNIPGKRAPIFWPTPVAGSSIAWLRSCEPGSAIQVLDEFGTVLAQGTSGGVSDRMALNLSRAMLVGEKVRVNDLTNGLLGPEVSVESDPGLPRLGNVSPDRFSGEVSTTLQLDGRNFTGTTEVQILLSGSTLVPCLIATQTASSIEVLTPMGVQPGEWLLMVKDASEPDLALGSYLPITVE